MCKQVLFCHDGKHTQIQLCIQPQPAGRVSVPDLGPAFHPIPKVMYPWSAGGGQADEPAIVPILLLCHEEVMPALLDLCRLELLNIPARHLHVSR